MKKLIYLMSFFFLLVFFSCKDPKKNFDQSLLSGKWQQGTLFEYYNADGTGYNWDEADNVTENEAQKFTWTLSDDNLVQVHIMEMGGNIPKSYTVTELSSTNLAYQDAYGKKYSFRKIQ
ncbi:MAG: hypothetical protein LBQ64_04100 [Bacteroidales bacterium]|nr:hypothetical protein [Bacteroidales bacterium]